MGARRIARRQRHGRQVAIVTRRATASIRHTARRLARINPLASFSRNLHQL
jgi:hypothetical protein